MSATPAAPYLTEFGSDSSERPVLAKVRHDPEGEEKYWKAKLAEARAEGFESGRAAAMAAIKTEIEEQRAHFARQLAVEREAWNAKEAEKLKAGLEAGLRSLEMEIADAAARVLAPFLDAEVCERAAAELRTEIEVLLTSDPGISLAVTGPNDLLQALRKRLGESASAVTYVTGEGPDIRISADQTLLATRLAAWKAGIEEAAR